jgi:hypothetical protein
MPPIGEDLAGRELVLRAPVASDLRFLNTWAHLGRGLPAAASRAWAGG